MQNLNRGRCCIQGSQGEKSPPNQCIQIILGVSSNPRATIIPLQKYIKQFCGFLPPFPGIVRTASSKQGVESTFHTLCIILMHRLYVEHAVITSTDMLNGVQRGGQHTHAHLSALIKFYPNKCLVILCDLEAQL